ncbi:efflux RND transporter periplasmic adaptor subunit [Planctomycetota bacterium]
MEDNRTKSQFGRTGVLVVIIVAVAVAAFVVGYFVGWPDHIHEEQAGQKEQTWWSCSMHPEIGLLPKPGKCPKCFMDLVPVDRSGEAGLREISFSEDAIKLMEIETTPVERKFVTAEIRMVGKIDYDETRVKNITAWVPGRIDRLYVDFTGIAVNKGDHMVKLYSPELISGQAELLQSSKAVGNIRAESSELVRRATQATLKAAREKLRLLGLTAEQIEKIESSGKPDTHIEITSPMGGIVIQKNAVEGMYVDTGTPIYTIADLSQLWVKLDAYESDLQWIHYGQEVEFTTNASPGEVFKGTISFIDPVLNAKTRTVKLRVNVDNPEDKLKPEMFIRAVVRSKVAKSGRVMATEMAGMWICPMHPDVVKAEAGICDICGMDLVTTESLDYVKADASGEAPLVIPASAPLITGKRAVVYVRLENKEKPTYEGREVVLGPRAGDYYIVESGLYEGEIVVTNGSFKIDSALQIQAKPSMMSAEQEPKQEIIEVLDEFRKQLGEVIGGYLAMQAALAADNPSEVVKSAEMALKSLSEVDMGLLSGEAHDIWMKGSGAISESLESIEAETDIEQARKVFEAFSIEVLTIIERFGVRGAKTLYRFHCPMAFNNKGADWLQTDDDTRNPYFGASMLKCGTVVEVISDKTK